MPTNCPFCHAQDRIWRENSHFMALFDAYPVADGHALVIPKKHVESIFDLSVNEQQNLWLLVGSVREHLKNIYPVDGFTIGINDGTAAGQTVPHAHVHIIPRRDGDVDDPRGGIRWVIPSKAKYW